MSTTVDMTKTHLAHQNMNCSPAKQFYSFGNAQRFRRTQQAYCKQSFYDLPSQKAQRASSLGKGKKSDFTFGDRNKPSPQQYNIRSFIEYNKQKVKGSTFNSRENLKFGSFMDKTVAKQIPGVGNYNIDKPDRSQKYSLGSRTSDPQMMTTIRENPGPGAHNIESINKTGSYFYRQFTGSGATRFNPPTSSRFKEYKSGTPGPGSYQPEEINRKGAYRESKFRSTEGGRWSTGERVTVGKPSKNPAPGYYRLLSEFGNTDYPPLQRVKTTSHMSQTFHGGSQFNNNKRRNSKMNSTRGSFHPQSKTQPVSRQQNAEQNRNGAQESARYAKPQPPQDEDVQQNRNTSNNEDNNKNNNNNQGNDQHCHDEKNENGTTN